MNPSHSEGDPLLPNKHHQQNQERQSKDNHATSTTVNNNNNNNETQTRRVITGCQFVLLIVLVVTISFLVTGFSMYLHRTKQFHGTYDDNFLQDAMRFDMGAGDRSQSYTATQFISFTISTMGGSPQHGECVDRAVDPEQNTCYLGDKLNITADAYHRLIILERVLHRLRNDTHSEIPKINTDPHVLKIFMLPEFFMRGPYGAYSFANMLEDGHKEGLLIRWTRRLMKFIQDDAFQDYLFVFGTIIVADYEDQDPHENWWDYEITNSSHLSYYNFAPVFKGGKGHKHYYVVSKKYISIGDFLQRSKLPDPRQVYIKEYAAVHESDLLEATLAKRGITLVDNNIIEVNKIRIGIEICLDHLVGTLWTILQTRERGHLVDVHLITSAGMDIQSGPNPVVPGGVVYLSDGEASSAACLRTDHGMYNPDQTCRIPPEGLKHIPHGGANYSNFVTMQACIDEGSIDLLPGYYSMYKSQGCAYTLWQYGINVLDAFKYYPPSIEVYPTIDLPKLRPLSPLKANNSKISDGN